MKKLVLGMVVEDEKVSVDDIIEQITVYEEEVQSVDILSFDKILIIKILFYFILI